MSNNISLKKALIDPASSFTHPREILTLADFTDTEKMTVLKRWEQDARELDVAEEEGMLGDRDSLLDEVIKAIDELDPEYHKSAAAPNKQGNFSG